CASGTPPFCMLPSGFGGYSAIALTAALTIGGTGSFLVDSAPAGWPPSGVAAIEAGTSNLEIVAYTVKDGSHIIITQRGIHGTTGVHHNAHASVTAAAPTVIDVEPTSNVVLVSTMALTAGSGPV